MDPLLLLAYFAVPATITLVAFVGLKLHERTIPPEADASASELRDNIEPVEKALSEIVQAMSELTNRTGRSGGKPIVEIIKATLPAISPAKQDETAADRPAGRDQD